MRDGCRDEGSEFSRQRFTKRKPRRVELGLDRLGNRRIGEAAVAQRPRRECHDRRCERRQRTGRDIGGAAQRADFALRDFRKHRRDQIGLARKIAIDRAGGDAGALRHRRDLHRRHAAFAGRVARRGDDRRMAGGEPAGDVFGAAIWHRLCAKWNRQRLPQQVNHDSKAPAMFGYTVAARALSFGAEKSSGIGGACRSRWEETMDVRIAAAVAALSFAAALPANAQTYPDHPITMIVPLAPGGSTDTLGRLMAKAMSATLGQTVIVENVSGAAGTIGVTRAERSAPDGYTVLWGMWGTNVA